MLCDGCIKSVNCNYYEQLKSTKNKYKNSPITINITMDDCKNYFSILDYCIDKKENDEPIIPTMEYTDIKNPKLDELLKELNNKIIDSLGIHLEYFNK